MSRRRGRVKKPPVSSVPAAAPPQKIAWFVILVSFGLTLAIFARNLLDGFLIDDAALVFTALENFPSNMEAFFRPDLATYWRPVGKLSFVPDALIWRYNPLGYHLTSLVLHLAAAALVYRVGKRFLSTTAAAVAAALFALHPIHGGAVLWVSARYDLLATVLVLAACLAYLRSLVSIGRLDSALALVLAILAMLTKEVALITPILIFILAAFFGPSSIWNNLVGRWRGVVVHFAATALVLAVRFAVVGGIGGPGAHQGNPQVLSPDWGVVFENYLRLFPSVLLTPVSKAAVGSAWSWLKPLVTVLGWFALLGWVAFRKNRAVWTGLLFGLTAAAPVSFFFTTGQNLELGYLLYLPSVGLALFAAALAQAAFEKGGRFGKTVLVGLAAWAICFPGLLFALAGAYHGAGVRADVMRNAMAASLTDATEIGPVYCEGFPDSFKGVAIFYDEVGQLAWPLLGYQKPGAFLLADENLLRRHPDLPPFREAARSAGFRHLIWRNDAVVDRTADTIEHLARAEQSETTLRLFLKVQDDRIEIYRGVPPLMRIEPPEVIPASSIDRLCLKMSLNDSAEPVRPGYVLTWTHEPGGYWTRLDYAPAADGFTCARLDRDPRWALAGELSDLFIRPIRLHGSIWISEAEILYRTKIIEIEQEMIMDANSPLWPLLQP